MYDDETISDRDFGGSMGQLGDDSADPGEVGIDEVTEEDMEDEDMPPDLGPLEFDE